MKWLSRTTRRILPQRPWLPAHDLLRDLAYRRLWTSILISSLGGQVTTPPVDIPGGHGRYAIAKDPQGATFAVYSMPAGNDCC